MPSLRHTETSPLLASSDELVRPLLRASSRLAVTIILPMIIATYFAGQTVVNIEINPYLYDKISKEYPQINTSSQRPCISNMNNKTGNISGIKIQNEIMTRVSTIELYMGLTAAIPAIIPIFILGPMSDKFGRKIGFILPIIGVILQQTTFAVVIGCDLDPAFFYIGQVFVALGGGFAAMLMTMFGVTADITSVGKQRAMAIAIMEGLQTLFTAAGAAGFAQWVKENYLNPLLVSIVLTCLSLVLTIFMPETSPRLGRFDLHERTWCQGLHDKLWMCCHIVKKSVTLYMRDPYGRLAKRRLCLAVFFLTVTVNFSKGFAETLFFMKFPLCWPASEVNTFSGVRLAITWVVIWIIMAVLQRLFSMEDRHVAIIGCVSSTISEIFFSVAVNTTMVYEAVSLGVMIRAIIPMMRSILSSLVGETEQGAVFAGLACIETVGAGVFRAIFNRVYVATLDTFPGTVFALFGILMFISLVILIILNILYKRDAQTDEVECNVQTNGQQAIHRFPRSESVSSR